MKLQATRVCESDSEAGCLMLSLPPAEIKHVLAWRQERLGNGPNCLEIEAYVHVTIAYGFTAEVQGQDVLSYIEDKLPIVLRLGPVTRFGNDRDVLKIDVDSPALYQLHYDLRQEFGDKLKVTYPDYTPHVTLAYVRPGTYSHLDNDATFDGDTFLCTEAVYSYANSQKKQRINVKLH